MKLNLTRFAAWSRAGFMVKRHPRRVVEFSDLNPEVGFRVVLSRWERVKLGAWFLFAAIAPQPEEGR